MYVKIVKRSIRLSAPAPVCCQRGVPRLNEIQSRVALQVRRLGCRWALEHHVAANQPAASSPPHSISTSFLPLLLLLLLSMMMGQQEAAPHGQIRLLKISIRVHRKTVLPRKRADDDAGGQQRILNEYLDDATTHTHTQVQCGNNNVVRLCGCLPHGV